MTNETYNVLFSLGFMYLKQAMAVSKTKIKFKYNQGNQTVFHNLHIKDTLLDFEKKELDNAVTRHHSHLQSLKGLI